ncbi:MAG TPA: CoA transferase [Dehalococcoidia bacterium]|nr:CoA transferase [Dehalococcoidia bacterium]
MTGSSDGDTNACAHCGAARRPDDRFCSACGEPVGGCAACAFDRPTDRFCHACGRPRRQQTSDGPLAGLRVLDIGNMLAGPFCSRVLADFGAEVIKVELPQGDPIRGWRAQYQGESLFWAVLARNKRPIVLDLRTEEGRTTLRDLAATADIIVENFRPGTIERWGLDYESLARVNPGLILVRISGYGQTGPYSDRAGFASVAEGMGGLMHLTGHPDRPPARSGVSLADTVAGLYGAFGAMMAALDRQNSGRGQVVDVALTDTVISLLDDNVLAADALGMVRGRFGAGIEGIAPTNVYPTRDGRWAVIGANSDSLFARLAGVLGRPEWLEDERYVKSLPRASHQIELDEKIAAETSRYDIEDLLARLTEAGIPCGPVYTSADILKDPHFNERGSIIPVLLEGSSKVVRQPGIVPRLTRTPGKVRHGGKPIGADTEAVLADLRPAGSTEHPERPASIPPTDH